MINIDFKNLTYRCEKPSSKIRSMIWPIIKMGRPIEEFADKNNPSIRVYREDLKRVTSYYFFDHKGRYVQISKNMKEVLCYNLDQNVAIRNIDKKIVIEQHCFERLAERKISINETVSAIKKGNEVIQYCLDRRKEKIYKNVTYIFKDLRVVASLFDNEIRVKTGYRTTEIHDANLLEKLENIQKTAKINVRHDYAIVDLDILYRSPLLSSESSNYCNLQNSNKTKKQHYRVAWEILGNTFGYYSSCVSRDDVKRSLDLNQEIIDNAIVKSSLPQYKKKKFTQRDFNPKTEYGLLFFYENKSFVSLAKRIYGLGLSSNIDYDSEKIDPVTSESIKMIGTSLTSSCGNEWIKSTDKKSYITIDPTRVIK